LIKRFGKPALIELLPKRYSYWILKYEFNFVDNLDKASALSTDQIDIENAERYDISYSDEQGKKKRPLILHCSPSGSIERCVYALLEKAYREQQKGNVPILPTWLAPTQVRLVPLSDKFVAEAEKIAEKLDEACVRADVDDRPLTMQKKGREAEIAWVNYVIVVGKREIESGVLAVRDRERKEIRSLRLREVANEVKEKTAGKPFRSLTLPRELSKRPIF
jgi:threonyl-tRNA synthetase